MQEKIITHFVQLTPENAVENFFGADGFFHNRDNPEITRFVEVPEEIGIASCRERV